MTASPQRIVGPSREASEETRFGAVVNGSRSIYDFQELGPVYSNRSSTLQSDTAVVQPQCLYPTTLKTRLRSQADDCQVQQRHKDPNFLRLYPSEVEYNGGVQLRSKWWAWRLVY